MAQRQALDTQPVQRKLVAFVKEAFHARTATQTSHFLGLEVDWRQIVDESIECNIPLVMFQVLVEVIRRVNSLRWSYHMFYHSCNAFMPNLKSKVCE
jgi:hypothetical protein